jgi:peptide/nickel transport system permease protein
MSTVLASSPAPSIPGVEPLPPQRSRGYWASVWLRFARDPLAIGAAVVVLLLIALAVFGPWLAPSDPYQASMLKRLKPIGTEGLPWAATNWAATCSRG